MNSNHTKHILFIRRLATGRGWGGLEKLVMEWFHHIDFQKCRVTLAVNAGCAISYTERLSKGRFPVKIVEYPFLLEGDSWKKFTGSLRFFKSMRPHTVVFLQGAFTDFSLVHTLAAFLVTGGRVYMHENLGAPVTPERHPRTYFGFIPSLELWRKKRLLVRSGRSFLTQQILVVSQEIKDRMVNLWGYPRDKVRVMYHGVDTDHFCPSPETRAEMRRKMGIGEKDMVIISTARLSPVKCLDRLIDAFDAVWKDHPRSWLLMVGGGVLEEDLKRLAASKTAKDRIVFTGLQQEIAPYLKMSDIFVLPSDNEGLSLALLEAMSTGLICVSTDCTGSGEVIVDGQNGYIVEKNTAAVLAALKKILAMPADARRQISQKGIEFIRKNFEARDRIKAALDTLEIPTHLN